MSTFKGRLISVKSQVMDETEGFNVPLETLISNYVVSPCDENVRKSISNIEGNKFICEFDFNLGSMIMYIYLNEKITLKIPITDIKINKAHNHLDKDSEESLRWFNIIRCASKPDPVYDAIEFIISTDISNKLDFTWSAIENDRSRLKIHFNMTISTEEVIEWWKSTYDRIPIDDQQTEWIDEYDDRFLMPNLWVHPILPNTLSSYLDISDTWIVEFTGKNRRKIPIRR